MLLLLFLLYKVSCMCISFNGRRNQPLHLLVVYYFLINYRFDSLALLPERYDAKTIAYSRLIRSAVNSPTFDRTSLAVRVLGATYKVGVFSYSPILVNLNA